MQAAESKPRLQAPSEIGFGNQSLGITAHLPLPFHFLTYTCWFVKDGTLPHTTWQLFTMLVHDLRHSPCRRSLL